MDIFNLVQCCLFIDVNIKMGEGNEVISLGMLGCNEPPGLATSR